MPRLIPIDPTTATGKAKELLDEIRAASGSTPNALRSMAASPAVLDGWLQLERARATALPGRVAESVIDFPLVTPASAAA